MKYYPPRYFVKFQLSPAYPRNLFGKWKKMIKKTISRHHCEGLKTIRKVT